MSSRSWWSGLLGGALLVACADDGGSTSSAGGGQMYTTRSSVSDGYGAAGDVVAAAGSGVYGVLPGTGANTVRDGWTVEYQKYLVAVGTVTLSNPRDGGLDLQADVVVDVQNLSEVGDLIGHVELNSAPTSLAFSLRPVDSGSFRALSPSTSEADLELMADGGYAVYIEGTIESESGRSCTPGPQGSPKVCVPAPRISFRWGLPHGVLYAECTGAGAAAGPAKLTFPAVHWLYTRLVTGSDVAPMQAQWIADADLDHDGETTLEELERVSAAALFPRERGYDLSGASRAISTGYDFLREQVRSLGRAGWGECAAIRDL